MAATDRTSRRRAVAIVLAVFAVAFTTLEVVSYTQKSATWDEPIHLTAGYVALSRGDQRVDPSHPPFVRMWAALPLAAMSHVSLDAAAIDTTPVPQWLSHEAYSFAHQFMYRDNDADRLLYAARFMVVLLGVLLGVMVFAWTCEWLGLVPAVLALVLYSLSPNISAHASLVTTDLGVTCFIFGAVYFLWRTHRRITPANLAGLSISFALAIVTKFSGLVLVPIVAMLLVTAVVSRSAIRTKQALAIGALLAAATWVTIWACYGFRYAPSDSPTWLLTSRDTLGQGGAGMLGGLLLWVDAHRLLPNAFTQGFLFSMSSAHGMGGFLAGEISTHGWWYYFPLAFLIKTPLALLILMAAGLLFYVRHWRQFGIENEAFVVLPVVVYFGVAMQSGINLGVRHILPIYPFVIVIAVAAGRELMAYRAGRVVVAGLVGFAAVQFASVYPNMLTFFSQAVGGPEHGHEYLVDSNLDWGQHLKGLKEWMDDLGVARINLAYFGSADPKYYGIDCTYLPGGPSFALNAIMRPELPGYVAVSETVMSGVYLQPQWRLFYRALDDRMPVAQIGNTIRVYWLDAWPTDAKDTGPVPAADLEAERALADSLLFGLRWNDQAIVHYHHYLRHRPKASGALTNLGVALAMNGKADDAVTTFRRAVGADPGDARAHRFLAIGLLGRQTGAGEAEAHLRKAVELAPGDAASHDVLGRMLATQGRFDEAEGEFRRAVAIDPSFADDLRRLSAIPGRR